MATQEELELGRENLNGSSKWDHGHRERSRSLDAWASDRPEDVTIVDPADLDDDGRPRRQANALTASVHVITAVIGSGVLSLSWSVGVLGWVAGPLILLWFAFVTLYTSNLLADCYRFPDPVIGKRNYTYMDAVRNNLGGQNVLWCGFVQYTNLVGTCIGYTITAATSMVAVQRSNCFHNRAHSSRCHASNNPYMVAFGACQLLFSQISEFHKIRWLSYIAAVMSIFYSTVALGLGIRRAIEGGHSYGSAGGIAMNGDGDATTAEKAWYSLQALGNIAFAYSFSTVLIEIQDTLRGPPQYPPESKTMRKAVMSGVSVPTFFYTAVASAGYLAFGENVPRNILTGFGFYSPFWLVDLANIAVVIHLVGAYQVFAQPVFGFVESWTEETWPNSGFIHQKRNLEIPLLGILYRPHQAILILEFTWFRVVWRSGFVVVTTLVAMLLPFFTDVMGFIGAFSFFPLTVYFPVEMYIKGKGIKTWSRKWTFLQSVSLISLVVSIAAGIGAVEGVVHDLHGYKPFHTTL